MENCEVLLLSKLLHSVNILLQAPAAKPMQAGLMRIGRNQGQGFAANLFRQPAEGGVKNRFVVGENLGNRFVHAGSVESESLRRCGVSCLLQTYRQSRPLDWTAPALALKNIRGAGAVYESLSQTG